MVTKYPKPKRPQLKVRELRTGFGGPSAARRREIPAGEFKARCLALMDEVQRSGDEYVITKRGVPVARLLPATVERRPLLGSLRGMATTAADIVSPIDVAWDVLEGWDGED